MFSSILASIAFLLLFAHQQAHTARLPLTSTQTYNCNFEERFYFLPVAVCGELDFYNFWVEQEAPYNITSPSPHGSRFAGTGLSATSYARMTARYYDTTVDTFNLTSFWFGCQGVEPGAPRKPFVSCEIHVVGERANSDEVAHIFRYNPALSGSTEMVQAVFDPKRFRDLVDVGFLIRSFPEGRAAYLVLDDVVFTVRHNYPGSR